MASCYGFCIQPAAKIARQFYSIECSMENLDKSIQNLWVLLNNTVIGNKEYTELNAELTMLISMKKDLINKMNDLVKSPGISSYGSYFDSA